MSGSLTEAQSYTLEARRAEEIAHRLEQQASLFDSNSASGTLNLSQAYREWGMREIERNRDFYGISRFDDVEFQLSPEGRALQGRFIETYADELRDEIEGRLVLTPEQAVSRPSVGSQATVRAGAQIGGGGVGAMPQVPDIQPIQDEVSRAQLRGSQAVDKAHDRLDRTTRGARGASSEKADDVKEW